MTHQTNNKSITPEARSLVEVLAAFAKRTDVMEELTAAHQVATEKLRTDPTSLAAEEATCVEDTRTQLSLQPFLYTAKYSQVLPV